MSANSVITSYSIHYTKLYESRVILKHISHIIYINKVINTYYFNIFVSHSYTRITSYNVCYTKLLRGPESNDLEFPDLEKISYAYGYPYYKCLNNQQISKTLNEVFSEQGPVICEVFVSTEQMFEPKSATRRLDDGTLVSAPREDLAPFCRITSYNVCYTKLLRLFEHLQEIQMSWQQGTYRR